MRAVLPLAWLVLTVTLLLPRQSTGAPLEFPPETLYENVVPSLMTLKVESKSGEKYVGTAFFALKDNVAVTAWHVIHDAARVTAKFPDGSTYEVEGFIDKDEVKDVALIRVENKTRRPMVSLSTTLPKVGSRTYVIGAPKGYEFSISDGLLSQIQKVDGFNQYQVSCPFSPGNSGGPIINPRGEVVGIAAWTRNGAQNVNFATPVGELLALKTDAPIKRWRNQTSRRVASLNSDAKLKTSPAEESKETVAQLKKLLQRSSGREITITVQQDGAAEKFTFKVPPDFVK